jgi:hypothetical protein
MKREKVYIAGPVTGLKRSKVEYEFNKWKNRLIMLGYDVVSPIDIVPANCDWQEAMQICFYHLAQCNKALFMENWIQSDGACLEMEFCMLNKITLLSRGMILSCYKQKIKYQK